MGADFSAKTCEICGYKDFETIVELLLNSPSETLQAELADGQQQARRQGHPILMSWAERTPTFEPIAVFERGLDLATQAALFAPPGGELARVGLGAAWAIDTTDAEGFWQVAQAWRRVLVGAHVTHPIYLPSVGPVLMGGFAFDAQTPATPLWHGFPPGRWVLPQVMFTRVGHENWVTYNLLIQPDADPAHAVTEVLELAAQALTSAYGQQPLSTRLARRVGTGPRVLQHELRPAADWQADVAEAAAAIRAGRFEKVVLARALQLRAHQPFSAALALQRLATHYTGCYLFAFANEGRCFLGATPEQLVRLQSGQVSAMSLAGSIRRGKTPAEDQRLGQQLLHSAKDRTEHAVVVRAIVENLQDLCANVNFENPPELLRLGNIQHLCTPITAQLVNGASVLDLVERLHPTPAVGGRPREATLRFIRDHEELDRGWYAGAIGWLDARGDGEMAVALRSALVHEHTATLFAGCGIMADSDPEREYAESRLKFRPMLTALTGV